MVVKLDDPSFVVGVYSGHPHPGPFQHRPICGVQPVAAKVVLDSFTRLVQSCGLRARKKKNAISLPDE